MELHAGPPFTLQIADTASIQMGPPMSPQDLQEPTSKVQDCHASSHRPVQIWCSQRKGCLGVGTSDPDRSACVGPAGD